MVRALAAFGVFVYHQRIGFLLSKYTGIKWFHLIDAFGALYAVPLFFLISGYCIHLSNIKYIKAGQKLPLVDYYKRRMLRLYPAYFVAILFSLAVTNIVEHTLLVSKADLFIHFFLLQGFTIYYFNGLNVVLWTISIEVALYILYPLFYYIRSKFSLNQALIFTFIVSCISIAYFSAQSTIELYQRYFVTNMWFAWCCGALLADKKILNESGLKKPVYKIIYAVILVTFIFLRIFDFPKLAIIDYQIKILFWTAPLLFVLSGEKWFSRQNSIFIKLLKWLGVSSYSLYLFHEPLIELKNFLAHEFLPVKLQPVGIIIGFLVIPTITYLSYKYIEKPFMSKKRNTQITAYQTATISDSEVTI